MPVSNDVANCTEKFDNLYLCATPVHQFKHHYMSGSYDSCADQLSDFKLCFRAKRQSDDDTAREIQKGYKVVERDMRADENSPTRGVIWNFKKPHEKGWA